MRGFFTNLIVTSLGLWAAAYLVDGVRFYSPTALVVSSLMLGLVNALVRPIVVLLTIPITFLSFGIFLLVINGAMIALVAWIVPGFNLEGLGDGVVAWMVLAVTNWLADRFKPKSPKNRR